jgi:hypothetical protein
MIHGLSGGWRARTRARGGGALRRAAGRSYAACGGALSTGSWPGSGHAGWFAGGCIASGCIAGCCIMGGCCITGGCIAGSGCIAGGDGGRIGCCGGG